MEKILKELSEAQREVLKVLIQNKGKVVVGHAHFYGTNQSTYYFKKLNSDNQDMLNHKINKRIIDNLVKKNLLVSPEPSSNILILNKKLFK